MADFTALKTAIQNAIKQNGNEEITGNILQDVLLAIVSTLGDSSINDLITALGSEATTRGNADTTLQQNINAEAQARQQAVSAEATTRGNADTALGGRIDGVIQSINAINAAIGNGYVYAGIATPSSTPTTGKVFYLALTAGTYTNFGNIAVTQGINILKYNGSAWSLDTFVGIDDTPTPNSPNLVKSGGAFDSVMTNGSAFDISAHFASGGTLTNWQGVDANPKSGSKKLVESGGVKEELFKLVPLYEQVYEDDTFVDNKFINVAGNIVPSNDYFISKHIPVNNGDVVRWIYASSLGSTKIGLVLYGSDDTGLNYYGSEGAGTSERTITINNASADYIVASFYKDNAKHAIYINGDLVWTKEKTLFNYINHIDKKPTPFSKNLVESNGVAFDVNSLNTQLNSPTTFIDNKYVNVAGNIVPSNDYFISTKVPVSYGDSVKWVYANSLSMLIYTEVYSSTGSQVQTFGATATATSERTVTITAQNAAYAVFSFSKQSGYVPYVTVNNNLVWTKETCVLFDTVIGLENYKIKNDNKINYLVHYQRGYYSGSTGAINTDKAVSYSGAYFGWYVSTEYIPVKEGDSVRWNFGSKNVLALYIIYDSNKERIANKAANNDNGYRTDTMPANAAYIRISFYRAYGNDATITPIVINGTESYYINLRSDLGFKVNTEHPEDTAHGLAGQFYPEQTLKLNRELTDRLSNRFSFIHISDNHGYSFGYANELLDLCPAKFIVNTGDMVYDKYSDISTSDTITLAQSTTKPVYLVLGNHDYSKAPSRAAVLDTFITGMNTHNGTNFDKTYYSVDDADAKVKCIFIDMNDEWDDSLLPDMLPAPELCNGKMSATQINWLIGELDNAITNNLHVCFFVHIAPEYVNKDNCIKEWCKPADGEKSQLSFLLDIVDGFIGGGNVAFTYNGDSYNHTFASQGHFIAWICGHTHFDLAGWLKNTMHKQFAVNVCQPMAVTGTLCDLYDKDKLGCHYNYVTIDTQFKSLSVLRIGAVNTIWGTKREWFNVSYE